MTQLLNSRVLAVLTKLEDSQYINNHHIFNQLALGKCPEFFYLNLEGRTPNYTGTLSTLRYDNATDTLTLTRASGRVNSTWCRALWECLDGFRSAGCKIKFS